MVMRWVVTLALGATLAQGTPGDVPLSTILERAGQYILRFEDRFSHVVTEERYEQEATGAWTGGAAAGLANDRGAIGQPKTERRELISDFLLVKLPGADAWLPFRDVFEVDKQRVRDRGDRLSALFLQPASTALLQARRIMDESARYNIGDIGRNFNLPVFALQVLHPTVQPRFRFERARSDNAAGPGAYVIAYREVDSPTLIHGESEKDIFSRGRIWIDPATGTVLRSELIADDDGLRATITTRFQHDPTYGIAVPVDMREEYRSPDGARASAFATYGRFRNFNVEVADEVTRGPRTLTDPMTGMLLVEVPPGRTTRAFFLAQFEVTQQQWRTVMGDTPSRFVDCGPDCPVENIDFEAVRRFLDALNARTRDARFRLPTEAEWQYACFTGPTPPRGNQPRPTKQREAGPVKVGSEGTNVWGLGDMEGNVAEWTAEGVVRGASWQSDGDGSPCTQREAQPSAEHAGTIGFRIAADLAGP